ncbi:hypothetical protein PCC9214_05347 [Planktothrix tepida]|uniref:Uncharacterized protein n=1 Tax=Planktothrix tepida PCC 9214 TaxID=671072 RepID=A0A1J1LIU2_9CYAN|nr:hypothetical protein [Planktothrix tepida]CAD5984858.1 hypothetical protein PCC9214_05309 [Planktothrix tepida]CAD5985135.1 hypothetical protein PCC9214_05347 [Planktothrix tepida]CUR32142.1 conserved hypothetical protein [Planktothrix tepida PCC 9214]
MPFTDAYGTWLEVATNHEPSTTWAIFDEPTQDHKLFRFKFSTDWDRWKNPDIGYRSFGIFRHHYHDDGGNFNLIGDTRKIYPTQEPQLIELPILTSIVDNPWFIRKAGFVRKFYANHHWIENNPTWDLKWSVTIELFLN